MSSLITQHASPGAARTRWPFKHTHTHTQTCNLQAEPEPIGCKDNTQLFITEFVHKRDVIVKSLSNLWRLMKLNELQPQNNETYFSQSPVCLCIQIVSV